MKLTQMEKILKAMIYNKHIKKWRASDFQDLNSEYFVGYEASARMSDLVNLYPWLFIVEKEGRFRTLELKWKEHKKVIKELEKAFRKLERGNW